MPTPEVPRPPVEVLQIWAKDFFEMASHFKIRLERYTVKNGMGEYRKSNRNSMAMLLIPFLIDFLCLFSMVCVDRGTTVFMGSRSQDQLEGDPEADSEIEKRK